MPPESESPRAVTLTPTGSSAGRALVFPNHEAPIFRGPGEINFLCPACRNVLCEGMLADKVWDLVIACGRCHGLAETPKLPKDAAATGHMYFPAGRYFLTETIDIGIAVMIGEGNVTGGGTPFPHKPS